MKSLLLALTATSCALIIAGPLEADAARIDARQKRQGARTVHGVRNGELTARETRTVVRQQRRVHRMKKRARSDGQVTRRERVRIRAVQHRSHRSLARKKHNRRHRN